MKALPWYRHWKSEWIVVIWVSPNKGCGQYTQISTLSLVSSYRHSWLPWESVLICFSHFVYFFLFSVILILILISFLFFALEDTRLSSSSSKGLEILSKMQSCVEIVECLKIRVLSSGTCESWTDILSMGNYCNLTKLRF